MNQVQGRLVDLVSPGSNDAVKYAVHIPTAHVSDAQTPPPSTLHPLCARLRLACLLSILLIWLWSWSPGGVNSFAGLLEQKRTRQPLAAALSNFSCAQPPPGGTVCGCLAWLRCVHGPGARAQLVTIFDGAYERVVTEMWLPRVHAWGYTTAAGFSAYGHDEVLVTGGAHGELNCTANLMEGLPWQAVFSSVGFLKFSIMLHALSCPSLGCDYGGCGSAKESPKLPLRRSLVVFAEADVVLTRDPLEGYVPQAGSGGSEVLVPITHYAGDLLCQGHLHHPTVNIGLMFLFASDAMRGAIGDYLSEYAAALSESPHIFDQALFDAMLGNLPAHAVWDARYHADLDAAAARGEGDIPVQPPYAHKAPLFAALGHKLVWDILNVSQWLEYSGTIACPPRLQTGCWGGRPTDPSTLAVHFTCMGPVEKQRNIMQLYTTGTCDRCGECR